MRNVHWRRSTEGLVDSTLTKNIPTFLSKQVKTQKDQTVLCKRVAEAPTKAAATGCCTAAGAAAGAAAGTP